MPGVVAMPVIPAEAWKDVSCTCEPCSPLGSDCHSWAISDCSSEHAVWSGGPSDVVYLGLGPGLPAASSSDSTSWTFSWERWSSSPGCSASEPNLFVSGDSPAVSLCHSFLWGQH